LLIPFSFLVRYRYISQLARFNVWWLAKTCNLSYEVIGREHIPKDANGLIFCKHQSTWETYMLQCVFPPQTWLLKKELMSIPFFGWALALLEPVAIERKAGRKALKQLLDQGSQRLKDGRWVVIFPEGTRVAPGEKGHYMRGGAMLAKKTAYPVVPVAHNAGEFWPKGQFIKRPGVIQVRIGPMINTENVSVEGINQQAEDWIESNMKEISPSV